MDIISNIALHNLKIEKLAILKDQSNTNYPHSFNCNYHGINFTLRTKNLKLIDSLKEFLPQAWQLDLVRSSFEIYLVDPLEFNITFDCWSNETSQDCYSYHENSVAIQRDFAAEICSSRVNLICNAEIGDGFYNFLRWFLSEKLMDLGKYVVHSSCVLGKNGKALLFLGHSGAGKTTITRLASPRLVLGDDMNIVSIKESSLWVEAGAIGGQFNSMIGYGKRVPVSSVFWLKQSSVNQKNLLDRTHGCQKIIASFANLHWSTLPTKKLEQLFNFTELISQNQEVHELLFTNNEKAWELLDP